MRFKAWLLTEDLAADAGSHWFYGSQLLPSDAYDWAQSYPEPSELKFLMARWGKEKELGRKFHNLNLPVIRQQKFTSVYSNTMPDGGGGFWKHNPKDRPNLRIDRDADLKLQGHRVRADIANVLWKPNPMIDDTEKLDRLFGEFKPKYPELGKDFDRPWVRKRGKAT